MEKLEEYFMEALVISYSLLNLYFKAFAIDHHVRWVAGGHWVSPVRLFLRLDFFYMQHQNISNFFFFIALSGVFCFVLIFLSTCFFTVPQSLA